jgi:hypothetical protein
MRYVASGILFSGFAACLWWHRWTVDNTVNGTDRYWLGCVIFLAATAICLCLEEGLRGVRHALGEEQSVWPGLTKLRAASSESRQITTK